MANPLPLSPGSGHTRGVLHAPGACRSSCRLLLQMCPAGPPSLSQPHPLQQGWDGGRSWGVSAGSPPGCRLGWVRFWVPGAPGGGTHRETEAALCTTPLFCRSVTLQPTEAHADGGGWAQAAPEGSPVEVSWSCPGALTGGGVSGFGVTSPAEPPPASSRSLLQPEPLVLDAPGTSSQASGPRWALEGALQR